MRVTDVSFRPLHVIPPHGHERACLAVVLQGSVDKAFARSGWVLGAAGVVAMPPEERHIDRFERRGARMLVVEPAAPTVAAAGLLDEVSAFEDRRLGALAWRLAGELHARDAASPLAIEGLALEMLAEGTRRGRLLSRARPAWLREVERYVNDNFRGPVEMGAVAAVAGVHPVHLARVFRAQHGVTLGDYVRTLRVEWAATRLASSADPLATIAIESGFADQSHFSRAFKRHIGLTPGQYRRARR